MTAPLAAPRGFLAEAILALSGFLVWTAHFLIVYIAAAVACARAGAGADLTPWAIGMPTVAAVAALSMIALAARRRLAADSSVRRFLAGMAVFGAGIALIAIAWEAAAGVLLPSC
jgi:hypothetical protein